MRPTLLALVLLCGTAWAQVRDKLDLGPTDTYIKIELDAHAALDSFLVWWDAYKAECWADSVADVTTRRIWIDSVVFPSGVVLYDAWKSLPDTTWVHEHRPTPLEFLDQYLRRKVK